MKKLNWLVVALFCLIVIGCQKPVNPLSEKALIPLPSTIQGEDGSFQLTASSSIELAGQGDDLAKVGAFLSEEISSATGFKIPVNENEGNIRLVLTSGNNPEAYTLEIMSDQIEISSSGAAGLFYGVQTLLQIFPDEIVSNEEVNRDWMLPLGKIEDSPEFGYRGSMLDVARHFFSVEDVKHYIDIISALKYNYLHLHLSDDQGWRIEIKSWPNLTEIGGSTEVGGGEGGFYTQEQYKEIVQYAADRFVIIVPEIDMPGHTNAALASYASLNPGVNLPNGVLDSVSTFPLDYDMPLVNPQPAELYTGTEVGFSTFATDLDLTYQFVDDVVREIVEMTPGPYFHIGGDESHVTEKDDYIIFINRAQDIVASYGKTSIGWDEVATATLLPGNIAQFWGNEENAILAKEKGSQLLMSPAKKAYLDMQYDSTSRIGLHWAAYIELDDAYNWDPANYLEGVNKENILGVEAPLWTETVTNREDIEYLLFPRILALSEVAWTASDKRSWEDFSTRIAKHAPRWEIQGITYYKSPKVNWE